MPADIPPITGREKVGVSSFKFQVSGFQGTEPVEVPGVSEFQSSRIKDQRSKKGLDIRD